MIGWKATGVFYMRLALWFTVLWSIFWAFYFDRQDAKYTLLYEMNWLGVVQHEAPMLVYEKYKEWHSADVLRSSMPDGTRKYANVYYFCPQQAGNRLHQFINGVVWSIVTNRTALFKYLDYESCVDQQSQTALDPEMCRFAGTEDECDGFLKRNPWIPTWKEFAEPLGLLNEIVYQPSPWTIHYPRFPIPAYYSLAGHEWNESVAKSVPKIDTLPYKVVAFPPDHGESRSIGSRAGREFLFNSTWSRTTARSLQRLGLRIMYGMILDDTLQFRPPVFAGLPLYDNDTASKNRQRVLSIAVHSRHQNVQDDGHDISRELNCLNDILLGQAASYNECRIFIMSDRPATIKGLQIWSQQRGCLPVTAPQGNETNATGMTDEHGPYSGVGFFRDLAVVSQARDGLVGMASSTATSLLHEMIMYRRHREEKELGISHRPFALCKLKAWVPVQTETQ